LSFANSYIFAFKLPAIKVLFSISLINSSIAILVLLNGVLIFSPSLENGIGPIIISDFLAASSISLQNTIFSSPL